MKNTTLIRKYAFHSFKNEDTFKRFLETQYHGHWLTGFKHYKKSLDCIAVKGILFTMEEYDNAGKSLTWGNKKKGKTLEVLTSNRYDNGYSDVQVSLYEAFSFRNDITYIQ
jgi:hypothetical protein